MPIDAIILAGDGSSLDVWKVEDDTRVKEIYAVSEGKIVLAKVIRYEKTISETPVVEFDADIL